MAKNVTRAYSATPGPPTQTGRRGTLGAGLVDVPAVPYREPILLTAPEVAVVDRFCNGCGEPVGRPAPTGTCPGCGSGFSFVPRLAAGTLVGGQYEVLGCLAHGGQGWIHLALDRNVNDRYVVLKGLIHDGDPATESAFLAEVEHPAIVKIHNLVYDGDDPYIVMEYIGGRSLAAAAGPYRLPVACAYALEALSALAYLHDRGLVYCDLKPDNLLHAEEQLKLIDLGGVRHLDDPGGPVLSSTGYRAPELAVSGPSVASDLYAVGRLLETLTEDEGPESYRRLVRRATHQDPARRFGDAAEMAEQLTGVLREALAMEDGHPRPAQSARFGPERYAAGTSIAAPDGGGPALRAVDPATTAAALPVPLVDVTSPAAGFLAGLGGLEPEKLITSLVNARATMPQGAAEIGLVLARARIEEGDFVRAGIELDELAGDWRADWLRAVALLTAGRIEAAQELFDELWTALPGEAAPKLALAFCHEYRGDLAAAAVLYETVWRTDNSYLNAAFGLARVRLAAGDLAVAVAALDSVPRISSEHVAAQVAAVASAVRDRIPTELTGRDLAGVGGRLTRLKLDGLRHEQLAVEVMEAALGWIRAGNQAPKGSVLLGAPLTERGLRRHLERGYRELARHARTAEDRLALVRRANHIRPRSFL